MSNQCRGKGLQREARDLESLRQDRMEGGNCWEMERETETERERDRRGGLTHLSIFIGSSSEFTQILTR